MPHSIIYVGNFASVGVLHVGNDGGSWLSGLMSGTNVYSRKTGVDLAISASRFRFLPMISMPFPLLNDTSTVSH